MKIPNNQNQVAKQINALNYRGVNAIGDDGSVCVQIEGSKEYVLEIVQAIASNGSIPKLAIGDGVQMGEIFINNDENDIHDELSNVLSIY